MCGRFSLGVDTDRLVAEFGIGAVSAEVGPRWNVAPTQDVAAVVRGPEGLRLGRLRWGLVPRGARDPSGGARLINARSETVHSRAAFRDSFRRRRCWIPADGFYEWMRGRDGSPTPFLFRLPGGRLFAMAGLWDRWRGPDGTELGTCTILTTRPAPTVAPVHDRMPVILPDEDRDAWLDPKADQDTLTALLRPFPGPLEPVRVSQRVNSVAHDDPACAAPVETNGNIPTPIV